MRILVVEDEAAMRDQLQTQLTDYIEKPFRFEELLARVQCIVRRTHGCSSPQIICGPYVLNTDALTASVDGKPLDLTTHEFRLLEILMLNAGKVLSATALAEHIYNESADHDSNVVRVVSARSLLLSSRASMRHSRRR